MGWSASVLAQKSSPGSRSVTTGPVAPEKSYSVLLSSFVFVIHHELPLRQSGDRLERHNFASTMIAVNNMACSCTLLVTDECSYSGSFRKNHMSLAPQPQSYGSCHPRSSLVLIDRRDGQPGLFQAIVALDARENRKKGGSYDREVHNDESGRVSHSQKRKQ
jgi:hypothetical protein